MPLLYLEKKIAELLCSQVALIVAIWFVVRQMDGSVSAVVLYAVLIL